MGGCHFNVRFLIKLPLPISRMSEVHTWIRTQTFFHDVTCLKDKCGVANLYKAIGLLYIQAVTHSCGRLRAVCAMPLEYVCWRSSCGMPSIRCLIDSRLVYVVPTTHVYRDKSIWLILLKDTGTWAEWQNRFAKCESSTILPTRWIV